MDDMAVLRPRVFVVEDDPAYQRLLELALRRLGCECQCCTDGRTALDSIISNPYDLVIIDIHIPELDGFMVACQLREMGYTQPLVAISALSLEGIDGKARAVGFNDFLQKPLEDEHISQLLDRYIVNHEARS